MLRLKLGRERVANSVALGGMRRVYSHGGISRNFTTTWETSNGGLDLENNDCFREYWNDQGEHIGEIVGSGRRVSGRGGRRSYWNSGIRYQ